jgi:hypothetical protein
MQFLVLFGLTLVFGYFFPSLFKGLYWAFILTLFTVGPACFVYIAASLFGNGIPFSVCCFLCFLFIGLPFTAKTAPE